ncbi:MAG: hypothetical protein K9K79_04055 [Desulfohalobiaceae bacterium]|nr:hypothetical protein [Desulfohalobiaceae bacterium]
MTDEKNDTTEKEGEMIIGPGVEGMSMATAKLEIDKGLRKELVSNYDIIELVNKGRYYTAKAASKDGSWRFQLLIDKQARAIQVIDKKRVG